MKMKDMLHNAIKNEIAAIERTGKKVKLKPARKAKIIAICVWAFLFLATTEAPFISMICLIELIVTCVKKNQVQTIAKLARKQPDKFIEDIIWENMII